MSSLISYLLLFWVGAVPGASLSTMSKRSSLNWEEVKYVIAFGDSYTFVQGTLGYPKYSFIGDYENNFLFTPEQLLSNRIVQNVNGSIGTSADGPNWIEYLTGCGLEEGLTLPSTCKVQLWDFAFAGADIAEKFLPLHHPYTIPMVNQTQQYLTYAEPVLKERIDKSKSVVAIWIGINDILDSVGYDTDLSAFYEEMIAFVFEKSVAPLYDAGYHNFLFVNLPPLHRAPLNQKSLNGSLNATMIGWWNSHLAEYSSRFSSNHKETRTLVYDAFSFLDNILDNPEKYGITDTTGYITDGGHATTVTDSKTSNTPVNRYFWFDAGHISSHIHKILAEDLGERLKSW